MLSFLFSWFIVAASSWVLIAKKIFPGEVGSGVVTAAYADGRCLLPEKQKLILNRREARRDGECTSSSEYVPHKLEQAWLDMSKETDADTCEYHRAHPENVEANLKWMRAVFSLSNLNTDGEKVGPSDQTNLSRFLYTRSCLHRNSTLVVKWTEWIEPLIGITRHPFSLCKPLPSSIPSIMDGSLFNIDYLLLYPGSWNGVATSSARESKKYLFDLGSNYYRTSLGQLLCKYQMVGVEFNEIFAWEAGRIHHDLYWESTPVPYRTKIHLYNVPVSEDPTKPGGVLQMLSNVALEKDFVALKIDVDNTRVEMAVIQAILSNQSIAKLIDELFFEYHYESDIMAKYWKHTGEANLSFALQLFGKLRTQGIRAHFWP